MNVAIERQGGVHRLARLGFWGSFVLICPILQSQAFKVYFTPRRWNCLCWRRSTSAAAFLWGNNIQLNTSQKKEGRDGTTWGDDKKKGVVKRRWLSGGTPEVNLFLFIPHPPSTRAFYFAPRRLGGGWFWRRGVRKKKEPGYVTSQPKDGPSRHPEKVYRGGEGHERGGRGEGRGQLRQRLYGGSEWKSTPSFLSLPS